MWNLAVSFFYGFILFFSFGPCPLPVCRPSGSTHVFVSLVFTLFVLCFCFETIVLMLCYLSCWVSPKEHFGDRNIFYSLGRAEGFNHTLSPQEVGGNRWHWCLNHQELAILLRKPLHRTYQELSWLGHSPRRDAGNLLDPSCCFGGISSPYHHSCSPALLQLTHGWYFGKQWLSGWWLTGLIPTFSSYSHSKEENPHGMYMYKGWAYWEVGL